jgi:hypothetical protein
MIIIGRLGYLEERHPGTKPVFAPDLATYRIQELPSRGDLPGWIFNDEAKLENDGVITVRGGVFFDKRYGKRVIRRNFDDFAYDIRTGKWMRLTNRNWGQFSIGNEAGTP